MKKASNVSKRRSKSKSRRSHSESRAAAQARNAYNIKMEQKRIKRDREKRSLQRLNRKDPEFVAQLKMDPERKNKLLSSPIGIRNRF